MHLEVAGPQVEASFILNCIGLQSNVILPVAEHLSDRTEGLLCTREVEAAVKVAPVKEGSDWVVCVILFRVAHEQSVF